MNNEGNDTQMLGHGVTSEILSATAARLIIRGIYYKIYGDLSEISPA